MSKYFQIFVIHWLIKSQNWHHTDTSQLICRANQWSGFYMKATLAFNELTYFKLMFHFDTPQSSISIHLWFSDVLRVFRNKIIISLILKTLSTLIYGAFRGSHPELFLVKVFWKYAANLQENTHAELRFQ